jgi:ABC-type transport system involved in cytochrome bd biosynthesis fused ATPase/permease subunit
MWHILIYKRIDKLYMFLKHFLPNFLRQFCVCVCVCVCVCIATYLTSLAEVKLEEHLVNGEFLP